jgi:predicted double-glycine peptidase
VIDEIFDPRVVRQQSNLSCGPASAEILLKDRGIANIEQASIENLTGAPTIDEFLKVWNQIAVF